MRDSEEYSISKWEEDLPSPEDLTPLSQTLISPHLALAFNIQTPSNHHHHPISAEFDSSSDDPARTLKRPRLVWTPQLHKRFVDAVAHLGIKNAVPKTIMQMMSVDGLTRENVASHLQKYRLYLKRMQGHVTKPDAAADRLFSSSPVPAHFLHHPPPPLLALHHHHQHQLAATMGYHQHQLSAGGGGGGGWQMMMRQNSGLGYGENVESVNGKRVLTLFPTAD